MNIHIGDTPEQLGSCLAADAVVVNGKIITKQQVADLIAYNAELVAMVEALRIAALNAIQRMPGGETKADLRDAYDATPTQHLRDRDAEVGRAGFVAGAKHFWIDCDEVQAEADNYAERVKAGEE